MISGIEETLAVGGKTLGKSGIQGNETASGC